MLTLVISPYYKTKMKTTIYFGRAVNNLCVTCYRFVPKPLSTGPITNRAGAVTEPTK